MLIIYPNFLKMINVNGKFSILSNLFSILSSIRYAMIKYLPIFLSFFILSPQMYGQDKTSAAKQTQETLYNIFKTEEKYRESQGKSTFEKVLPNYQMANYTIWKSLSAQLERLDKDLLSETDRMNAEMFDFILQDRMAEYELEAYLIPFNAEGGFYNKLSYDRRTFDTEKDYEEYAKRLRAFPRYMKDNMALLRTGMEKGITAPRLIAANYEVLILPYLEQEIEYHLLYKPYLNIPEEWDEELKVKLEQEGERLIKDQIIPAYEEFDAFMQNIYLPAAREDIGISGIPNGKEYYEQRIRYFTTLDMTPDEVFETGEQEVARIHQEMEAIIDQVDFKGSFEEFLEFLRTDPQFYPKTPRDLLKEASYYAKKIDGQLPNYFGKLPRLPYGVEPVPASIAPNYTAGRYSPGSVSAHRAGNYWVNTYKLESRPLYALPALTLHEAVPGHHLQMALAQELEGLPKFRKETYLSAFGEGWALYCEWLGQEMGIYETPYEHFGRLTYEMWRACRLVVDVGIHYKGWSREKALEFLTSNTALSIHECNTEIDRYIGWPGQAVSYKIGELKIREWRKKAEAEIGANFNIREFHDILLENGSLPLFLLEERVNAYIEEERQAALAIKDQEEWIQLFNGNDLTGWQVKIRGHELDDNFGDTFSADDGILTVNYDEYEDFGEKFGHLFYHKPYSYYRLRVEYRFVDEQAPNGPGWAYRNSGVMIHGQPAETMGIDQDFPISIEVQLLGGSGEGERPTANLCTPGTHVEMNGKLETGHCFNSSSKTYHGDKWVTVEILALGDSLIQHIVEDEVVMEYQKPQIGGEVVSGFDPAAKMDGKALTGGTISLQSESHPVEFRTVELLNLEGCTDPKAVNYKSYYVKSDDSQCVYK